MSGSIASSIGHTAKAITSVYKNISQNPVIIKEIAVGFNWSQYYNTTPPNAYHVIARSVLDTPVTIAPGDSYSFTYSIEI